MPLQEVFAIQSDPGEFNIRNLAPEICNHCILNCGVAKIAPGVGRQENNSRRSSLSTRGGMNATGRVLGQFNDTNSAARSVSGPILCGSQPAHTSCSLYSGSNVDDHSSSNLTLFAQTSHSLEPEMVSEEISLGKQFTAPRTAMLEPTKIVAARLCRS